MADGWLHEEHTWRGFWWLPEEAETTRPGFLKYDPHQGITLTLIGGFQDMIWKDSGPGSLTFSGETRGFPVIHGLCTGERRVTLLDAVGARSRTVGLGFSEGPSEQTIRAAHALIGIHLENPDDAVFNGLECAIEDTLAWSGSEAMTAQMSLDHTRKRFTGDATITLRPVEPLSVEAGAVEYRLSHTLTLPAYDYRRMGSRGRVEDKPVFSLEPRENASLQSLSERKNALVDLLALATGRNPAVLWTTLQVSSGHEACPCEESFPWKDPEVMARHGIPHEKEQCPEVRPHQVDLYSRGRGSVDPDAKAVDAQQVVFTLSDIPFDEVLPKWLDVRAKFQASCNILISSRYSQDTYVEASTITAVAAAEAFHKSLKEPPLTPPEVMDDLVARAVDAMPDDRKQWIRAVIPRGHSLRQRLDRLAERMPESCRHRLLPDPTEWAKAATKARNSLSHSGESEGDVLRLYAVMRVTRAVVLVNILLELGLSEDRILKALADNGELRTTCALAHKHLAKHV